MRDDFTPTNPQPIDVLNAQLEAFRKDPTDGDLYAELRTELRKAGQPEPLAELCELRAPHEPEAHKAAAMWAEAGEARLLMGHDELGERDLREALRLDPASDKASARLTERLMVAGRFAAAAQIMEDELAELARRADDAPKRNGGTPFASRRAQRHRTLAELWEHRLGRVDRALEHWQRAWQLEPERSESIEAARAIYASLGDDAMVARLYEAELQVLGEAGSPGHVASLELALGRLKFRQGDAAGAARHLEHAVQLDRASTDAREALAEVYASPAFQAEPDSQRRASELFLELGKRRMQTQNTDEAIGFMRRALGVDPYSRAGTENLEEALAIDGRWEELERLYRHQESITDDDALRVVMLRKRAALYEERLDDRDAYKECLEQLAAVEPPGGESVTRLRALYREDQQWPALAALIERELEAMQDDPARQVSELLELATIAREHLNDRDRAAEQLHRVLTIDPRNTEALERYNDHFRERRDWRGLADLTEFAIESAREGGAAPGDIVRQLEELAQLAELRLGDVDRAVNTWRRIEQIEPDNPRAREALRRLASRSKMWESLVGVLEQEAASAPGPRERADALRRMAQVYRERQVSPRRAIQLYEEVLQTFPGDEASLKALAELYEREGDDAGLARTLRRQLDIEANKVLAAVQAEGKRMPTARDWPVAQRVERLTTLRRLATMYEQRLADVEGVVFACAGILEILPGDRDALDRMERVLDKSGDYQRLEQTLEYHAEAATGPAERAKVMRRLARLADDRNDELAAMERWERVLKAAATDADALARLADLYERHGRAAELAKVLERALAGQKPPKPGTPEAAKRAAELRRYAITVDEQLGDEARATKAWHAVVDALPFDRQALDALARLHAERGEWRNLAEVLERQAPLYAADEPAKAAEVGLQRARLLEERLGAPGEAIKALEALLADVDPANLAAHKALRRLYEARGDFDAAVRIAEREMYLADDDQEKIARGLEIGLLCRDQLGDGTRALQAFERVLAINPEHDEALTAAAELYAQVGDWRRHIEVLEARIPRVAEGRERRALLLRIAHATAEKLHNERGAFEWYREAHDHAPDAHTIAELRRAAEAYGLWKELAQVYEDERARAGADRDAYVAASREIAAIAERRLDDRERAMLALQDALRASPLDEILLSEAERIALEADEKLIWMRMVECLGVPLEATSRAGKVALHTRRARIFEERLDDPARAVEELLRAFSWSPERDETRQALYALAERTRRWNDVVGVEAALFARAATIGDRVTILRRKAQVIEEHLHERVRAFRTHLGAFLLAPEDNDTVAHLWRLARDIGTYKARDRRPEPEPPPAHVEPPEAVQAHAERRKPQAPPSSRLTIRASTPTREPTEELSASDLVAAAAGTDTEPVDQVEGIVPKPEDTTMELDISDLQEPRQEPTIELRTEDLLQALASERVPPAPTAEGDRRAAPRAPGAPPPPPPRAPRIQKLSQLQGQPTPQAARRPPAPAPKRAAAGPGVAAPRPESIKVPRLPLRDYTSAWEEFATAYEVLPAADTAARLRWLFRAAEVWESGAEDLEQAFATLKRALELAPDDSEPRARLHRLAADHQEWDRLARLYEEAADAANTADAASALFMEVAAIRTEQGRPRETELLYRRVLGMRPDDGAAREKLEELFRAEERWVDLAASLEERTDPRLGAAAPDAERPTLLRELASIYADKLSRPHDAREALERLRELAPDDLELLHQIADIDAGLGKWKRVISTLGRIADIAEATPTGREAMRRIGEIYEREVELPDRAIEAYRHLIDAWPDDAGGYEALDRLYQDHARWAELADTLRRRAALAQDPAERAGLLRRRARVLLDWLSAPDEAASALRHARTIAPEDPALADDLVEALTAAGREREAAAVLEGRIEALTKQGGASGDIAALLIRLAHLRVDRLNDRDGARTALDRALQLVPDHPTALSVAAKVAGADADPRAYAAARLKEADALADVDDKVAALLDAGRTLHDKCNDYDGARDAFGRALALQPANAEATWALAGLVEEGGDLAAAAMLLEKRLDEEGLEREERARILTQLAALARRTGVDAAAERRLDDALGVDPTHLPAVIAKADLLEATGRHGDLEEFLRERIPKMSQAPADARAELDRRLALAYEALGRDDEAYQTLLEADRLHRGDLKIKLALGENRYRARRWREAALHLGALAHHPDAEKHAAEVADGLYHAALAEIRSLRPEKAEGLYRRTLALKPNYAPALHALAELEMEKGNTQNAADLLTRQASATEDPAERLRLFEALGDLSLMALHDEDRARTCYEAAVNAANPLESRHLPLLEKLLERQDLAGDNAGAGRTAELMASFGATPQARAARYTAAAQSYLAAGDGERARAAAKRAIEADPYDLTGVTVASDLLLQDEQYDQVAALLGRALSGRKSETSADIEGPRIADLWRRLADARRSRGDLKGATAAYEQAVEAAPESDAAQSSRRELIDLWDDDDSKRDARLAMLRTLARVDQQPAEVLALARAMCRETGAGPVNTDGGRATLELAAALGETMSKQDVEFLGKYPERVLAADESYGGVLDADDRAALTADEDDEPLAQVLALVWEAAPLLWTEVSDALERCGAVGAERITAKTQLVAAVMFPHLARAVSLPATVLYRSTMPDDPDIRVVCVSPPLIVLGPRLQDDDDPPGDLELRFLLGRAAELARPERIIAAGLPVDELDQLIGSLRRAFGGHQPAGELDAGQRDRDQLLRTTLPVKLRGKIQELLTGVDPRRLDARRYVAACQRAADRVGLLLCGDIATAIRMAGGKSSARHLIDLALRDHYFDCRAKLGVGAGDR